MSGHLVLVLVRLQRLVLVFIFVAAPAVGQDIAVPRPYGSKWRFLWWYQPTLQKQQKCNHQQSVCRIFQSLGNNFVLTHYFILSFIQSTDIYVLGLFGSFILSINH